MLPSRSKPVPVFDRVKKRLHHLRADEVAAGQIKFIEPEFVSAVIRILRVVRVASQVAKVLHQDERTIRLICLQGVVLRDRPEHLWPGIWIGLQLIDQRVSLRGGKYVARPHIQLVNEIRRRHRQRIIG